MASDIGSQFERLARPGYISRGGFRGSGRAGWSSRSWRPQKDAAALRPPSPPRGPLVEAIYQKNITSGSDTAQGAPKITDCDYLASYSWLDKKTPTIAIPGIPPVWKPLDDPVQLEEDAGEYFRDPNAANFPDHPIEPAVKALFAQNPDFHTDSVDIFACSSTFGNLLRFVRGEDRSFRFTLEIIGDTVFFLRRENSPTEKIPNVRGYGHAFPERYTAWAKGLEGSQSHQRLISYTFAGLRYVIRFECDGYLKDKAPDDASEDKIAALPDAEDLTVQKEGMVVPQKALFDLKTRSAKRMDEDFLAEQFGRLWATQTPNFILAFHQRGVFGDIRVQHVRSEIDAWENQNREVLQRLGNLVDRIVASVKGMPDGKCEIYRKESGPLEVRRQVGKVARPLSEPLCKLWAGTSGSSDESDGGTDSDGADAQGYHSDDLGRKEGFTFDSDDESEKDYTACSAEDCGYCGRCRY